MGRISKDAITQGFSGKLGDDLVFRRVGNQTFFALKGKIKVAATERQKKTRSRFRDAAMYANVMLMKPETSVAYAMMASAASLHSAYLAAIKDYMTKPEIENVNVGKYLGAVGNTITVSSKIPFKIVALQVTILNAAGTVLEQGPAQMMQLRWRYTASVHNPQVAGSVLIIKASDRLGKVVEMEVRL